ncbi:unnamed protein product [Orchesella dallaii]|uniref:C2H2-type domain-containing protein n=1 Tax=Orchesella dallaii TaxID=48710 RepID=A0ABP1PZQ3_9HEXA
MDVHNKSQFCLICCAEVERRVGGGDVIKQEVEDLDENDLQEGYNNDKVEAEGDPSFTLPFTVTVNGKDDKENVFQCVYKLFNVKNHGGGMWKWRKSGGADNHVDGDENEQFPFCERCSTQLLLLFKLQNKVEELKKAIKMKVLCSENKFERSNVYMIDKRYYKIRRGILENKGNESKDAEKKRPKRRRSRCPLQKEKEESHEKHENFLSTPPPPLVKSVTSASVKRSKGSSSSRRRVSSREPKPVLRFGVDEALPLNLDGGDPIVMLSKEDKHKAERYQDSFVKVENQPLNVLDDDDDDQEEDNEDEEVSVADPLYEPPSPIHSFSEQEEDEQSEMDGEDSNESESWILPTPHVIKSKKRKLKKSKTRKNDVQEEETNEKVENLVKKTPKRHRRKRKRGRGRPRKDSQEDLLQTSSEDDDNLPGPKLKFKKSSMTKVDRKTGTITFLKVPLTRLEGGLSYQCTLCSSILPNAKRLMSAHVIREHTDRFVCTLCGKRLSSTTMLRTHLRAHTGAAPKIKTHCPICAKPFSRQYLLDTHRWSHYNEEEKNSAILRGDKVPPEYEKKFQCEKCAKRFTTKHLLQYHHTTNHLNEEERAKELCPTCGIAVFDLRGHVSRAHKEVPEEQKLCCTQCPKKFARSFLLMRHRLMVHSGRKFKCEMCPREFATKKQLKEHTLVHMNVRKFQCEFCASAFVRKDHLLRHTRVYHDDGSKPKRPAFIRGPDTKAREQRNCF